MGTLIRTVGVVLVCWLFAALGGCSAAPVEESLSSTHVLSTPEHGRSLADAGFTNEIADRMWLPSGIEVTYQADQPNLVIVVGVFDEASTVQSYLESSLPGLGWTITNEADGGLLFEMGEWHGGYARGETTWALTVRND